MAGYLIGETADCFVKSRRKKKTIAAVRTPIAVLADIHANLEALDAVLADIDRLRIRSIVCVGDVVGYGADPEGVLDRLLKRKAIAVAGNHDADVIHGGYEVNSLAREALEFTRARLALRARDRSGVRRRRWKYLQSFPPLLQLGGLCFVHGSPRYPLDEYIYGAKDSMFDPDQLRGIFPLIKWVCFCGHTHKPCVIRDDFTSWYPDELDFTHPIRKNRKYIVNVGSVGQPRDANPRASYVVFDGAGVEFRRLPYDVKTAMEKIREIGPLSKKFSVRLERGV